MSRFWKPNGSSSSRNDRAAEIGRLALDLAAADPASVQAAVGSLESLLAGVGTDEYRLAVDALCSLFYIDTADRPELEEALNRTADLLAGQGTKVIPLLLRQMEASDIKSHLYLARALGRMGPEALPKLRDTLATAEDPYMRSFVMYAIGKMNHPEVMTAIPEVLGGLMHPDKEVRDTAARTLGKIATTVPPGDLTPRLRTVMFDALVRAVRDPQAPVRAKAMRSLGKMAAAGLLDAAQQGILVGAARAALGETEEHQWDSAFIVRREAQEALAAARRAP